MSLPSTPSTDLRLEALLRDLRRHLDLVPNPGYREDAQVWLRKVEARLASPEQVTGDERRQLVNEFTYHCVRCGLQPILAAYGIPYPPYNHLLPFEANIPGPWAPTPTWQVLSPPLYRLLGFPIGLPFGISASALTLGADWIEFFARRGCHVITYKTVRSEHKESHPAPNWVFLEDAEQPLSPENAKGAHFVGEQSSWPANPTRFSMANSFGVPSAGPETWQADIRDALLRLRGDQLLIVSVMGSSEKYKGDALREDFVKVARLAEEAGARAIELNLSCPNTVDPETRRVKSVLCEDSALTLEIVSEVRARLKQETRLVAKFCYLPPDRLKATVLPLVKGALVDGISGINTLQAEVRQKDGAPTFGEARLPAGISGVAIRELGFEFVRSLERIRRENGASFDIIAMGGVMTAADVAQYMELGAAAVQSASGLFRNPDLPREVYEFFGGQPQSEAQVEARERVLSLLSTEGPRTFSELQRELESIFEPSFIIATKTRAVLSRLEAEGLVAASRVGAEVEFKALEAS